MNKEGRLLRFIYVGPPAQLIGSLKPQQTVQMPGVVAGQLARPQGQPAADYSFGASGFGQSPATQTGPQQGQQAPPISGHDHAGQSGTQSALVIRHRRTMPPTQTPLVCLRYPVMVEISLEWAARSTSARSSFTTRPRTIASSNLSGTHRKTCHALNQQSARPTRIRQGARPKVRLDLFRTAAESAEQWAVNPPSGSLKCPCLRRHRTQLLLLSHKDKQFLSARSTAANIKIWRMAILLSVVRPCWSRATRGWFAG